MVAVLKSIQILAAVLITGGPAFLHLIWRPALRQVAPVDRERELETAVAGIVRNGAVASAIILSLLAGYDLLRLAHIFSDAPLLAAENLELAMELAVETTAGRSFGLRLLTAIGIVALRPWRPLRVAAQSALAVAVALLLLTFPLTGHAAASANQRWLQITADLLHMGATAAWFGGVLLFALLPWIKLREPDLIPVVARTTQRFSRLGLIAMTTLAVTGFFLFLQRTYGFRSLIEHDYGKVLLAKIGFLAGVLALAAVNRFYVERRLSGTSAVAGAYAGAGTGGSGDPFRLQDLLRRLLAGEVMLGVGILILAGTLTSMSPPIGAPDRFTVVLTDHRFEPATIELTRNWPVRLVVENQGSTLHTYVIRMIPHEMVSGLHHHDHGDSGHHHHGGESVTEDMKVIVKAGGREVITFIPHRAGSYEVYCMVEDHSLKGMRSTITVK